MIQTASLSFTTVAGSGGTQDVNEVINANKFRVIFIRCEPSNPSGGGPYTLELFQRDTFLAADLAYQNAAFSGEVFDPIQDLSGTPTLRNDGPVAQYEDLDASEEIHCRMTNNDTVAHDFTVTIDYIAEDVVTGVTGVAGLLDHVVRARTARTTLSAVSGASVTATNLIPDGALVIGVSTEVSTALGTSNGTTGYDVGDGTDVDRWGSVTGTADGTETDGEDFTSSTVQIFTAANNVVITAVGGNFDGTGAIDVFAHYLSVENL